MPDLPGVADPDAGEWVLYRPCGCPSGCALARPGVMTEPEAWAGFYPEPEDQARRQQEGYSLVLMTRAEWDRDVVPGMRAGCPHAEKPAASG